MTIRFMWLKWFVAVAMLCAIPVYAGFFDGLTLGKKEPVFLQPDQAFGLGVAVRDARTLTASFRVTPDYYLYRDKITFNTEDLGVKVLSVALPHGEMKRDPNFGDLEVFHESFKAAVALKRSNNAAREITLNVSYQGCSEKGLCYPPIKKQIKVALPAVLADGVVADGVVADGAAAQGAVADGVLADGNSHARQAAMSGNGASSEMRLAAAPAAAVEPADIGENENSRIARVFKGSFWLVVSFFFGAGLLLAFTPCMFPMVPILSGIIVGHGHKVTHRHGFMLSLAYVLGMALTYAAVGVAAGLSGTLLSSALQTPWVLGAFAVVFVLLSLSMFGFYELQLPTALQSRLSDTSNRLHGGHFSGVFLMGALSAVIVGPCVAAPLAGALLYIGQTHDARLGGVALFSMALGMGVPLMAIGASAGTLLPHAGAWMESVKRFFGVLLLGVAIWIVSPLIPVVVEMMLWAALLIASAVFSRALDALPHNATHGHKLLKVLGLLALLVGIAYLVGALSGARDMLKPLGAIAGTQAAEASSALPFKRIKTASDLAERVKEAEGRPVMLDFYADWCISCKEMERNTFADRGIRVRLRDTVLLQADVTADDAEDQALLQRFKLYGPPAILFFDKKGREEAEARVMGYQDVEQFTLSLKSAGI